MKGNWVLVLGLGLRIWGCDEKCRDGGEEIAKPFLVSESVLGNFCKMELNNF